jgi:two-component system response regulator HydG
MAFNWPGNVRELENVIERAVVVADGPTIRADHIPGELREYKPAPTSADASGQLLTLEQIEKNHIQSVLRRTGWNIKEAAGILGIHRVTRSKKIKQLGLRRTRP